MEENGPYIWHWNLQLGGHSRGHYMIQALRMIWLSLALATKQAHILFSMWMMSESQWQLKYIEKQIYPAFFISLSMII